MIDAVQQDLKPTFVKRGLMIGEFHRFNNVTGLRSDRFYPLRMLQSCLVIRNMVPSDTAFLKHSSEFLEHFIRIFGGDCSGAPEGNGRGKERRRAPPAQVQEARSLLVATL